MFDGEDLRELTLSVRKTHLARLLARCSEGIFIAPFEQQGEIGPDLFKASCDIGLEGMVSKRADRPYHAERSKAGSKSRAASIRLIGGCRIGFS